MAFLTIAFTPLVHKLYIREALSEIEAPGFAPSFITRHYSIVLVYVFIFLGIVASYAFWFVALPADESLCQSPFSQSGCFFPTKGRVFEEQSVVFGAITGKALTAKAIGTDECKNPLTRSLTGCFGLIFFNNFWVLNLAIIFSFLYGAGAIFLISWNASVIGTFIGIEIFEKSIASGIERLLGYFPHGSFEVLGYFFGAVAGGVVSVAMISKTHRQHAIEIIAKDAVILVIIAYLFLAIGAVIEAAALVNPPLANQILLVEILLLICLAIIIALKKGQSL